MVFHYHQSNRLYFFSARNWNSTPKKCVFAKNIKCSSILWYFCVFSPVLRFVSQTLRVASTLKISSFFFLRFLLSIPLRYGGSMAANSRYETHTVCNRLGGDTTPYFSRVNIHRKANKYVLFVFLPNNTFLFSRQKWRKAWNSNQLFRKKKNEMIRLMNFICTLTLTQTSTYVGYRDGAWRVRARKFRRSAECVWRIKTVLIEWNDIPPFDFVDDNDSKPKK